MCVRLHYSNTTLVKSISAFHFQRKRTLEFSVIYIYRAGKPLRFLKIVPFLDVSLFSLFRHRRHWGRPVGPLGMTLAPYNVLSDITDVIFEAHEPPLGDLCPMEQRTGLVDTTGQCTAYRHNKIPVTGVHNKPPCHLHSLDRIMGENPLFGTTGRVTDAL